jgi:hypothetical protein
MIVDRNRKGINSRIRGTLRTRHPFITCRLSLGRQIAASVILNIDIIIHPKGKPAIVLSVLFITALIPGVIFFESTRPRSIRIQTVRILACAGCTRPCWSDSGLVICLPAIRFHFRFRFSLCLGCGRGLAHGTRMTIPWSDIGRPVVCGGRLLFRKYATAVCVYGTHRLGGASWRRKLNDRWR